MFLFSTYKQPLFTAEAKKSFIFDCIFDAGGGRRLMPTSSNPSPNLPKKTPPTPANLFPQPAPNAYNHTTCKKYYSSY
jgi:hypothetical protein